MSSNAVWLIKEAYYIACWFYTSYKEGTTELCNEFVEPINHGNKINILNSTIKELENTLRIEKEKQIPKYDLNEEKVGVFTDINKSIAHKMNLNSKEIYNNISIDDIFSDYQLTNEQTSLIKELNAFMLDKSTQVFLLKGYAGTGKTFITKGLTEYLTSIGREFILAAPTGKAAKVIKEKTLQDAYTIHKTIYSYDNLKEYKIKNEDGSETFKFYFELAENYNSNNTIYIIDEASMISNIKQEGEFFRFGSGFLLQDLLKFINLDHNDHNKKIILIGDNAQLPPIGINYSPALDIKYLQKEYGLNISDFELTEVVRQQESSGILSNSILIRNSIKDNIFNEIQFNLESHDIHHVDHENLMKQYLQSCDNKINGKSIIIASTNNTVDSFNRQIRTHFFPNNSLICSGDKVMSTSNNNTFGIFVYNGDFGLIRKVYEDTIKREIFLKHKVYGEDKLTTLKIPLWFKKVEVGFKDENDKAKFFECYILENILYRNIVYKDFTHLLDYKQVDIDSIETKALYVDFVNRANQRGLKSGTEEFKQALKSDQYFNCLKVKFGYAITCHKAQGSEWDNVFVDCKTHEQFLSKNYFRWIYTAITRTKKNLYLINEPNIEITDSINFENIHMEHIEDTFVTSQNQDENNFKNNPFNIEDKFLQELYKKIVGIVNINNIKILDLQHNQNQEQYTFESNNEHSRVIMYYNAQDIVTSINSIETNNLSNLLKAILEPLKNHIITVEKHTDFIFDEKFLEDFYLTLKEKLNNDIIIANIEHLNYMERYSFSRNEEIAIIDFTYNGRSQFTRTTPNNRSNSRQLIQDILGSI
jgi:hypothetical protein